MSTLQTLQGILIKDYRLSPDQLAPEAVLTALGLDSLSVLELMFKIEDKFNLKITEDTPNDLVTIADVVKFIDGLLSSNGTPAAPSDVRLSA